MKQFDYTIQEAVGIHARPAGLLVKEVKKYKSTVTVIKGDKSSNALKLMALMGMGVKWKARTRIPQHRHWKLSSKSICN